MTTPETKPRARQRMKTPEMLLGIAAVITALGGPAVFDMVTGRSAKSEAADRKHALEAQLQAAKEDGARRRMYDEVLSCRSDLEDTRAAVTDIRVAVAVLESRVEMLSAGAWTFDEPTEPLPTELERPTAIASKRPPTYDELFGAANAEAQVQMAHDFDELEELEEELGEE